MILVPGFLAGDSTLALMARVLREQGFRTYRSSIHVNAGCTLNAAAQLETRLESIALRRGTRVQIVGHSLGGMLARGLAVRRPDLVSGIVTLGSPMLAPGAHHAAPDQERRDAGPAQPGRLPGLMSEDCVAGECARQSFDESRQPVPDGVGFTADLLQARRHRRLAGLRRPARRPGRGDRLPRRPGLRPAGHRRSLSGARPRSSAYEAAYGRPLDRALTGRSRAQCSKSMAANSRSFSSWCSELIDRIVPLRERITSECVVAPPAR